LRKKEREIDRTEEARCWRQLIGAQKLFAGEMLALKTGIPEGVYSGNGEASGEVVIAHPSGVEKKRDPTLASQEIEFVSLTCVLPFRIILLTHNTRLTLCCFQRGRLYGTHHDSHYTIRSRTDGDLFPVGKISSFHETRIASHHPFRTRRVAFAKFIRVCKK
jgi:hypothetical protein